MTEPAAAPETRPPGEVADAVRGNWVDRLAPPRTRPFLRLSRADRPIGTWLLLLPCWWGALLAAAQTGFGPRVAWVMAASAAGAWLMRGAGCTWNDIADRDFDARVARTRSRPIPSGQVTVPQALAWMAAQAAAAFLILLTFHPLAIGLGVGSLALVAVYPFAKRFTWWPQAFLGLAFNWGALLAYAAVAGRLSTAAVALYLSGIAWTLFYDTVYAHQDKEDDALIGVRSTARLFGARTRDWLRWFLAAAVILMGVAVMAALAPGRNVLALVLGLGAPWGLGWHLAWQLGRLDTEDPAGCLRLFRTNRDAGLIAALFLALAAAAQVAALGAPS
jgi:4-hydroxybenzoate polyprenyltransferase